MKSYLSFVILVLPLVLSAQDADSSAQNNVALLLEEMDSIHRSDSIRRMILVQEIASMKGASENKEKESLVQKLRQMELEDSLRGRAQIEKLERLKLSSDGFAVTPFDDTLFFVYTPIGSFSARDRASAISSRIEQLYDDPGFVSDSLLVARAESSAEILYRDMMVMSVNELEALWHGKSAMNLAIEYQAIVSKAIISEREVNSTMNIALRGGAIVLIIAGIYVVVRLINRLFRRLKMKVISLRHSILKGIRFRGYQFLDTNRELRVVLFLSNVGRLLLILLAMYIALPLLFSVFPWTRGIAETLIGWITTPLKSIASGFVNYLPNLFTIAVVVALTHYFVKFLKFVAEEIESGALTIPGFFPDWAKPTLNIVRFLVYAFSFVIIFPYLPGSDSPIFQGVSVFVGILFSLGSSSAISNAVAGLVITYMRPFKTGDRIKIGEVTGDVIEKSLLVTRIRTIKNEDITLPNSAVLSGHTINYTTAAMEQGLILHTNVTIGYDAPWKKIHSLLISAALDTEGIMNDENHKPFVLQTSLDDFYVSYQINAYTSQSNKMAAIYSALHQNIQDKFNEGGVEILSPHYRAARDGNMTTIPTNYLPPDYKAPSFNVSIDNGSGVTGK